MLLEKMDFTGKKNRVAVGYDLGDETSQISYCFLGGKEPETISAVAGEQQYNFPTMLAKRLEVNQWFYGREAVKHVEQKEAVAVEHLLELARSGEEVLIGGETFDPVALLALFIKRSLSLLGLTVPVDHIEVLMITVEQMDHRMVEVLHKVAAVMQLKTRFLFFQSHLESFYFYTIHQPREIWNHEVLLCDFDTGCLKLRRLAWNRKTRPVVAFASLEERPEMSCGNDHFINGETLREELMRKWDAFFQQAVKDCCQGRVVSTVYLIGRGFEGGWCQESLKFLCRGRRVFQGNNLYSKGACYGALEKLCASEMGTSHVFLGNEKLKANLGMKVLCQGKEAYYALMDAGVNWFEAQGEGEFILEDGRAFSLLVTLLTGRESKEVEIVLDGMPERKARATRVKVRLFMKSENRVGMQIEDLGFGEIYPATHKKWEEEFEI